MVVVAPGWHGLVVVVAPGWHSLVVPWCHGLVMVVVPDGLVQMAVMVLECHQMVIMVPEYHGQHDMASFWQGLKVWYHQKGSPTTLWNC